MPPVACPAFTAVFKTVRLIPLRTALGVDASGRGDAAGFQAAPGLA